MKFIETGIVDYDNSPDFERQQVVLKIYRDRHLANLHKMNPIPVCKIERDYKDRIVIQNFS